MKVWQAGSHLSEERGADVRDWSWRRSRRRIGLLVRLALPYRGRTVLSLVTLLAYTLVALAPPYLAKLAIDQGIQERDLTRLTWIITLFLAAAVAALLLSSANTYLTGWVGERVLADLRNKLFAHLERLSLGYLRAQPRRRDHQPDHERRRGARPARHGRRHEPDPEHAAARRHGRRALPARLAARARHARGADSDGARHRLVPEPVEPRLPARPRAARPRHGDARRGHRRHARRPVLHARAGPGEGLPRRQRPLPRRELRDDRPERDLLPRGRPARVRGDRDRLRLRRLARLPRRDDSGHALRLRALPLQLLRPDPAALAALQHLPLRDRCAGQDHRRARRGAAGRRPGGRRRARPDRRQAPLRERPLRLRPRVPRGPARARARRPGRDDRGARRPHRRRQVDDRQADRTLLRPDGGTDHDRRDRPARGERSARSGVSSGSSRRRASSSAAASPRTSPSRAPTRGRRRSRRPPSPSAPTASSASWRTATPPSWASAARACRSASASSSRSRGRCWPTRAS